jgi:hypothetical protein
MPIYSSNRICLAVAGGCGFVVRIAELAAVEVPLNCFDVVRVFDMPAATAPTPAAD